MKKIKKPPTPKKVVKKVTKKQEKKQVKKQAKNIQKPKKRGRPKGAKNKEKSVIVYIPRTKEKKTIVKKVSNNNKKQKTKKTMENQTPTQKITLLKALEIANNSYSTIWSKDNVINLLKSIEQDGSVDSPELIRNVRTKIIEEINKVIPKLRNEIEDKIDNLDDDIVDKDSAEFSLSGNTIELDSVQISADGVWNDIEDNVSDILNDLETKVEDCFEELLKEN